MKKANQLNQPSALQICSKCVLPGTFPGIRFDDEGVCNFCKRHEKSEKRYREDKVRYKKKFLDLLEKIKDSSQLRGRPYDVLMAYSGGKDSSYTLKILKEDFGLKILAVTFNNGFLSSRALKNIQTITETLGIDHLMWSPNPQMLAEAFRHSIDSDLYPLKALERASSICNTCATLFKSISIKTAFEMGIPLVAYGWSPGQAPIQSSVLRWNLSMLRQTRDVLLNTLRGVIGNDLHSYLIPERLLDSERSKSENTHVLFLYNIHPLAFLDYDEDKIVDDIKALGWQRPDDTDANSTNCLLNAFAIQIHQENLGFHPYSLEIAGLVRNGLMSRKEGLEKLSVAPDERIVQYVKDRLGL